MFQKLSDRKKYNRILRDIKSTKLSCKLYILVSHSRFSRKENFLKKIISIIMYSVMQIAESNNRLPCIVKLLRENFVTKTK